MKTRKRIIITGLMMTAIILAGSAIGYGVALLENYTINENISDDILIPECESIVVITDTDYSSEPASVPYQEAHNALAGHYSGNDLSVELRDEIVQCMINKAEELGEDPHILFEAIKTIYPDWEEKPRRIPCYAEKAVYNDESIWAIAFNRANGFEGGIGHFELYFVSIPTLEAQWVSGCNSTAIVYHNGCR